MHPYKVAYGGRNSLKSHSFAGALLTLGIAQDLRILCAREVQKSLAQSVHQLLQDKIEALGYGDLYDVTDEAIRCRVRDTLFRFTGLSDHTADSIKSYEGFDIAWLEESQPSASARGRSCSRRSSARRTPRSGKASIPAWTPTTAGNATS
jgi:phage terminase large subunit